MTTWTTAEPPAAGWYRNSTIRKVGFYRWWDGMAWSAPVHREDPASHWIKASAVPADPERGSVIEWRGAALLPGSLPRGLRKASADALSAAFAH